MWREFMGLDPLPNPPREEIETKVERLMRKLGNPTKTQIKLMRKLIQELDNVDTKET